MSREVVIGWRANQDLVSVASKMGVRFLVIGGTAVFFHAPEREAFDDLDLLLEPSHASAAGFLEAMKRAGGPRGPRVMATADELAQPSKQIRERSHFYLDVLTAPKEISFQEHYEAAVEATMLGTTTMVRVASIRTLLLLLQRSGSTDPKHRRDAELLERAAAVGQAG